MKVISLEITAPSSKMIPTPIRHTFRIYGAYVEQQGQAVAQLAEALRYRTECRGLDSRCIHWNFSLIFHTIALGSTQPLP